MAEGYTIPELLTKVLDLTGKTADTGANDLRVYQALTAAGRAAATWKGSPWSWMRGRGSFVPVNLTIRSVALSGAVRSSNVVTVTATGAHTLVVGQYVRITGVTDTTMNGTFPVVASSTPAFTYASIGDDSTSGGGTVLSDEYILRTVNSNEMASMRAVTRVYQDDDWMLKPISWREYRAAGQISYDDTEDRPFAYVVTEGSAGPVLHLLPTPNTTDRMFVDYVKFHPKLEVTGDAADLLVPFDYQEGVYVSGATWLLRRDVGDIASLASCPEFVEAMDRMQESSMGTYDKDPIDQYNEPFSSGEGLWPNDRPVAGYSDGFYIGREVSL